jgi:hypothetical protein
MREEMALGGKRWYQMSGKITTRFQWLWSQMGPYRTDIFALAGHPLPVLNALKKAIF